MDIDAMHKEASKIPLWIQIWIRVLVVIPTLTEANRVKAGYTHDLYRGTLKWQMSCFAFVSLAPNMLLQCEMVLCSPPAQFRLSSSLPQTDTSVANGAGRGFFSARNVLLTSSDLPHGVSRW
jgi:hypothetical protein